MTRIFLDDELHRVFGRADDRHAAAPPGAEFTPPLDVIETSGGVLVTMDVAGVTADSVKVMFVRNTLVIVGQKRPAACEDRQATFHLAERAFGRLARGVRLAGAFDVGRADATLKDGELRVQLPRIAERRGGEIRIRVRAD
jgi:HSP20 family protein